LEARILVVEDEVRTAQWIRTYLEKDGFSCQTARDGNTGLKLFRSYKPDLLLLDLMLPGIDGNELCRIIRKESDVPVIMLTAKGSKEDRLGGFGDGADDYITKPFEPEEVILRIRAVLKRSLGHEIRVLSCGPITLDLAGQTASVSGRNIELTHAQFSILTVFMNNPNVVLSRNRIIELAFGDDFDSFERSVDTHIRRIRKLIHSENYEPITTVYGGGYKLVCADH